MSPYAYPYGICSIVYLLLGGWVVIRQKNKTQRLYGVLCLSTCMWQGIWALLLASQVTVMVSLFWLRVCYSGIVIIPAVLYHLIVEFTSADSDRRAVHWTYLLSCAFAIALWSGSSFVSGFYNFSWGFAARAGSLHPAFGLTVGAVIGRITFLLIRMLQRSDVPELRKRQARWVSVGTAVYCGGSLDILSNYGVSFFPLSFLFTSGAFALFSYAMLRYEFLEITVSRETEAERRRRQLASDEMAKWGMSAAFPLVSQGEVMGYLLLGEKMSEESYSKEDLLLLRIVANQAALAYQRVRYLEMAVHGARTEMLGEIAGGFAHEIKTPLANISLPAELTYLDLQDLENGTIKLADVLPELKLRMKDIMNQAFKASEKIEAVRQFSKPGQVKLESVSLEKIFDNSISLLAHLLRKTNAIIKTAVPSGLALVRGDSKQLEIVFVNLIKNAAEAMAANASPALAREIRLGAREEGDWIISTVKDSGPGIKRTDFGHLFEAYFSTKGSEGTGMGLFLSQQVIKAHGGSIQVRSDEGQGTEFVIRLPKFVSRDQNAANVAANVSERRDSNDPNTEASAA